MEKDTRTPPELYCRINLLQNAKGEYRSDETVSVRAEAPIEEVMDLVRELMWNTDTAVKEEVARRERDRDTTA